MTRRRRQITFTAIIVFLLAAGLFIYQSLRKAELALDQEREKVRESNTVDFAKISFTLVPGADAQLFSGPAQFRGISLFQDRIYAATSAGLKIFSPNGELLEQWTSADGLPSLDLTSVIVHDESLWIGTSDAGILQWNGNAWLQILPEGKYRRSITQLHSTPQGILYVGTAGGLLVYKGTHLRPLFPDQLDDASITALEGDAGHLWIGTFQKGLYLSTGGTLRHYGMEEGLSDALVTDIEINGDRVFVSTASGVLEIQDKQVHTLAENLFVTSLATTREGLWFTTQDGQIRPLRGTRSSIQPPGFSGTRPASPGTRFEKTGTTTVVLAENEIQVFKDGRMEAWIVQEGQLSASNISSLLRTRSGSLWVGFFDEGIDELSGDLSLKRHLEDETLFCINYLSEDSESRIYVATANGLAVFQADGSMRVLRERDGLLSDRVQQAIPLDAEGRQVAIATAQGFTLKENDMLKSLFAFHGLVNNHVYALASDSDQLYLGTLGGMNRIQKMMVTGTWTEADSGLKRNWINALASVNDTLYVGTYGSGVQAFTRSGEWIPMDSLPEDLEINPNGLYFDGNYLFCGTLDRGFYFMDVITGKWRHFSSLLPGQNVTSFTSDQRFLYVGTTRGLLRIRYEALDRVPDLS